MRALSSSETRLLTLLGGILFLGITFFGFTTWAKQSSELKTRLTTLRTARLSANGWVAEQDQWQRRKDWLDATQPTATTTGEGDSSLLQRIQQTARAHNIEMTETKLMDPTSGKHYQQSSVRLKAVGTLEDTCRWMVDLLQPANFQAVTDFSAECDKQDPKTKIACDLVVVRWYQPKRK